MKMETEDLQLRKRLIVSRMNLQRVELSECIDEAREKVYPVMAIGGVLRNRALSLAGIAGVAGFLLPLVKMFFSKKQDPSWPDKGSSWKSYILPILGFALKFALKRL